MDVRTMPSIRKKLKKFSLQEEYESRVIWRHLTAALEREDAEAAAAAKHEVSTLCLCTDHYSLYNIN